MALKKNDIGRRAKANDDSEQIAYSIPKFQVLAGDLSRTTVYREIRDGELKSVKVGRRRIIPRDAALDWLRRKLNLETERQ
jgi:excisionase family DNA binding protein